ncbi:hypothetical protein H0I25_01085 [Cellulophaga sp. HaHa_2_95]|uniref:hypothetical protein n=1 Tax=Cellulophaga sp. HaHa_2_95 TaxID=2745558 RepID=UPI001C4F6B5B|nr:hypothetical protein [Cellulophaga sp. HaHa_2_95]QXP54359.1 hypothetical protein H0I25_01085 [Cellulophaga sp. HaHa_2_95]
MGKYLNNHQTFVISTKPPSIDIERVYPHKGTIIIEANDLFYRVDRNYTSFSSKIFGGLAIICGIWFLSHDDIDLYYGTFSVFVIFAGLFFLIYGFTVNKENKTLLLDRINGIISYPDMFYAPLLKGKFEDIKAVISVSGDVDGTVGREYLKFVNTFKPRKLDVLRTISYKDPYEEWSLYVWYMDKNRPLPPGTAFDEYREKDFERRKRESFPKPLFESYIPTPEATKEQQAERKKIGGW